MYVPIITRMIPVHMCPNLFSEVISLNVWTFEPGDSASKLANGMARDVGGDSYHFMQGLAEVRGA